MAMLYLFNIVTHIYNHRAQDAEQLDHEVKASLGYIQNPVSRNNNKKLKEKSPLYS